MESWTGVITEDVERESWSGRRGVLNWVLGREVEKLVLDWLPELFVSNLRRLDQEIGISDSRPVLILGSSDLYGDSDIDPLMSSFPPLRSMLCGRPDSTLTLLWRLLLLL